MNDTRERVAAYVADHPGVHFSALAAALGLANGQVQHHTRKLRRSGDVVRESVAGRTHFYPPGYDADERRALALLRRETPRDVVRHLLDGPVPAAATADALGIARSTLDHHVGNLRTAGVVEKRREGERVVLALVDAEHAGTLLETVEPSPAERAVDRFTSLVDDALDS